MTDKKIDRLSVPDASAGELIAFLIRPVRELENKLKAVEQKLADQNKEERVEVDRLAAHLQRLEEKLDEAAVIPRKHEHRISVVEGQSKHVPDLKEQCLLLKGEVAKHEARLKDAFALFAAHNTHICNVDEASKAHKKRLDKHDAGILELAKRMDEKGAILDSFRSEFKEMRAEFAKKHDALHHQHALSMETLRHDLNLNASKVEDIGRNQGKVAHDAHQEFIVLNDKMNEHRDMLIERQENLNDMVNKVMCEGEDWSQKVHDRVKDMLRSQEILEERFDKFGIQVKELKAHVGV